MIDAGVLPPGPLPRRRREAKAGSRRAGDAAPTLRLVVDALIDGRPVKWEAVSHRVATPFERRMTQQVRAIARLSAAAGACGSGVVSGTGKASKLECALSGLSLVQVSIALAAGAWLDAGSAAHPVRWAAVMAASLAALGLLTRWRRVLAARLLGQLLLLLAAWQARPFLEAFAAAGAPVWMRVWWQALCVAAFVPAATWRLARECPPAVRLSPFDRASSVLQGVALGCSVGIALAGAAAGLGVTPMAPPETLLAPVAAAWGLVSLITVLMRNRGVRSRAVGGSVTSPRVEPRQAASAASHVRWQSALGDRLDAIVAAFRGTHSTALAALGADLQHARSPREVATALTSHVGAALHPTTVAVVSPASGEWTVVAGRVPPLAAGSALACMLSSADEATRVDAAAAVHALLPADDREWVSLSGVATFVRLASRDGETLAGLLVGAHADGRRHSRRERAFIAAAARAAAMALTSLDRPLATDAHVDVADDLSFECEACGRVSDVPDRCSCGGGRQLAALPSSLHGAFRVERRLGRGGMGVVYLGCDLRLDRPVALKTLPSLSSASVASLRSEARAMAAVAHPSFAVLYGLDDWRGTPVLVTEYLAGGTLATRLAEGPMPVGDALALGATLADALATLHDRGWLHRDIKPSNIGFCGDGTPKLLDFGLTRWRLSASDAEEALAGTPLYLSPELLDGEQACERDDVWALALVVAEMIGGAHPWRVDGLEDALRYVRCRAPMQWTSSMPPNVAHVLTRALHPTPSRRLATAREFATALRAIPIAH